MQNDCFFSVLVVSFRRPGQGEKKRKEREKKEQRGRDKTKER
jgi:hypothetical protein